MNLNKVLIAGHLSRDPELRHTANNNDVCNFAIAINRKYKQDSEKQDEVVFVDCTAWAKAAELITQYLKKGSPIFVEGRLTMSQWQDKDTGANRSKLFITVENFQFIGQQEEKIQTETEKPLQHTSTQEQPVDPNDIPF